MKNIIINNFENENFSLDAILVIYINKISIPPTITKNSKYEIQKFNDINPVIRAIKIVWINKFNPIDNGWVNNKGDKDKNIIVIVKIVIIFQRIV